MIVVFVVFVVVVVMCMCVLFSQLLNSKRNRKVTEPEIMTGLHHKNIVTLRAHYVINNQNFIVLDYCERGALRKQKKRKNVFCCLLKIVRRKIMLQT